MALTDYSYHLHTAVELARQAGLLILKIYETDFSVSYKGKSDPVTEADQRANDLIVEGLQRKFPQDSIVAEESFPPRESVKADFVWYVDPLDGTKEFISKNGEFSVMIGLAFKEQACPWGRLSARSGYPLFRNFGATGVGGVLRGQKSHSNKIPKPFPIPYRS